MIASLGIVGVLLVLRLAFPSAGQRNALFTTLGAIAVWLMIATRSVTFGADTGRYISRYAGLEQLTFADIYIGRFESYEKDRTFWLFAKTLSELGASPRIWIAILAAILMSTVGFIIHRYSRAPLLSFVVFVTLGYSYFGATALRQALAVSVILLALHAVIQRKRFAAVSLTLFGALFHSTALVFLFAIYGVSLRRRFRLALLTLGFLMATILATQTRSWIAFVGWSEGLSAYAEREAALTWSGFIVHGGLVAACWTIHVRTLRDNHLDVRLLNLATVGIFFLIISTEIAEAYRLAYYFNIAETILVANSIAAQKNPQTRRLMYYGVTVVLLSYMVLSGNYSDFSLG